MLEQMWKEALQFTQQPAAGRSNSALGQVRATPSSGGAVSLGEAAAAPTSEGAKVAQTVRQMADEKPKAAWTHLQAEFDTQKLVWESLVMTKRGNKDDIAKMGSELTRILQAQQSGDEPRALEMTDALLRVVDAGNQTFSQSMVKACRSVLVQNACIKPRHELAERLDTASVPATLPRTDADKKELEAVLVACDLGDAALETSARRLLLLPLPKEERGPSKEFFAPVYVTGSRKLSEIVNLNGPPVSAVPTMSTASRLSGFAPARPVGSKKSASLRGSSMGAVVGATTSSMSVRSGVSEVTSAPASFEPKVAAAKVRSLAKEKPPWAWTKLAEEFDVQKLVWQSQLLTKKKYNDRVSFQTQTEAIITKLEDILNSRKANPEEAVSALDQLVRTQEGGTGIVNEPTVNACKNVVKHNKLVCERLQLAERLDTAHVAATLPRGALERRHLEDLVLTCEIEDVQLARSVREALTLSIPAELGPPVRKKKTASSMSAVSSKRSSSIGAVTTNQVSVLIGAPVASHGGKAFQPPSRFLESI